MLHTLLKQKVEAQYILGTIISAYVDMYRIYAASKAGVRVPEIAELFGV